MNATLFVVDGKTTKRKVALKFPCVLGRSREADVTVAHPLISRRHCELSEANGLLMLRDLVSLNGTMIGGRRISSAPLLPDAEFTIGPLTFRVMYDYHGDLESLPPISYLDEVAGGDEINLANAGIGRAETPLGPVEQPSADIPLSLSDSNVVEVQDLLALADAEPADTPPGVLATPPWPAATADKRPTEFLPPTSLSPSVGPSAAAENSPWATEAPEVESTKAPNTSQKPSFNRSQAAQTPTAETKTAEHRGRS